jgi:beta-galactosidase
MVSKNTIMRKKLIFLSIVALCACTDQNNYNSNYSDTESFERETPSFFSEGGVMPVGAYYYPEHWSADQWERDLKNMAGLGFDFTHFGEFAWARMEPREGEFNFGWLDTCVALAAKNGLKVIMCTPTPCPPKWLTTKHPEILVVNEEGYRQDNGGRLHANGMNEIYRKYVERIICKMAERYGNDERIWGWQLDNEPHFATYRDYSNTAVRHFRQWLKEKYGTIGELNKAWGNAFWSQDYISFDHVVIPNTKKGGGRNHTSHTDFQRFTADELAKFLRYQSNILKKTIINKQWITTNFAYYKFLPEVDLFRSRGDLNFASHTMYLLSTYLNTSGDMMDHRLGSGMELSFSNELAKSIEGYTGIMELQPGQINWGSWNSRPLPGAVRMWIWHTYGLNDKFVCTYRFRQPIYGGEQFHEGIMETDGITVSHGGKEYVQAIKEIKELQKHYVPNVKEPEEYSSRRVAFLWKMDNIWSMENAKHNSSWDTWAHYYTYYENLKTFGCPVTFITEDDAFDAGKYPCMIAPAYEMVDDELIAKWKKYAEDGGQLILSCRTGLKDNNSHLWEQMLQEPVWELIGAKVDYYDQLPAGRPGTIDMDGQTYKWHIWGDILVPDENTRILAKHTGQFYKGAPVIVQNKIGKGTVTYIGTWSVSGKLERDVIQKVMKEAGATLLDLPNYVFTEWREGFWVTVNYTAKAVEAPVHEGAEILIGEKTVEPGGVCVWK